MRRLTPFFCLAIVFVLLSAVQVFAQSGTVVVYAPHGPEITDPIIEKFKAQYPDIEVQLIKAGTGELLARIRAEKGNPAADVMWGGSTILFDSEADLFAVYQSPEDQAMLKSDPNHKWHPFAILCQPILVNTNLLKEDEYPKMVKDLNDPKWQDKIALADPNKSGTGFTIVSGISGAYGWDFVQEFVQYCRIAPGSDAMFKAIKDGEVPVGFINEDLGIKWEEEGLPVKMIYAPDVVTVQMDAIALVDGGPHPELGKVFLDFICSKEVHEIARDTIKRRSARKDVEPPEGLPALGDLKLYPETEPRDVVNAKFTKILQELGK
ncbi:LysR substrate-binding protein [Candidatus Vecturithrix granuli]|uniref:LysR substrate-binding protein n=1 Tax=Vecturithrix granuli TaxID=1499967 RepID=A0A0S6WBJ7_VECG1|nr:LysR substrate-binding protein [Candidatus Vecturithrix granuli]